MCSVRKQGAPQLCPVSATLLFLSLLPCCGGRLNVQPSVLTSGSTAGHTLQVVPYLPQQLDQLHDPSYGHTRPSWTQLRRGRAQGGRQRAAPAAGAGQGVEGAPPVYLQHLRAGVSTSALLRAAFGN